MVSPLPAVRIPSASFLAEVRPVEGTLPTTALSRELALPRAALDRPLAQASRLPKFASPEGDFTHAAAREVDALGALYRKSLAEGLAQPPAGEIRRVGEGDLPVNLIAASPVELRAIREEGIRALRSAYYFTSGAGLWSRGGGQVKALVPFNHASLLSPEKVLRLHHANDLVNSASPADALLMSKTPVRAGETEEQVSRRVVDHARSTIDTLIREARSQPRALSPLALKFANVALASRLAETYVPFDIATSEQTHPDIHAFVERFKRDFEGTHFHPEARVQRHIVDSLREYFHQSHLLGETHLFGYQRGFPALHPESGAPLPDPARIGEGAGRSKGYLDETGRTGRLLGMGKTTMVFENVEVVSDLPLIFGAHARAGRKVSVILVPQRDGLAGGNPFWVKKADGTENLELHEQSVLPPHLVDGNAFFNSNTILQPLDAAPPTRIGFEIKSQGTQARAKQNSGDVTHDQPTSAIVGRPGFEYENFKYLREYATNGQRLIDTHRALWSEDTPR